MDLDRQSIEKRDFPFVRRGYDAAAVDAHLAALAGEVESLKRAQHQKPRGSESLASAAAMQVQAIVEAAETTAADIKRQAELEARRVGQEAERDAEHTRNEAISRAQAHTEEVSKAATLMLQRVGAMENEVSALVDSLRTGANRLTADLALLEGNMGDLYDAAGRQRGGGAVASPSAPSAPAVEEEHDTPVPDQWTDSFEGVGKVTPATRRVEDAAPGEEPSEEAEPEGDHAAAAEEPVYEEQLPYEDEPQGEPAAVAEPEPAPEPPPAAARPGAARAAADSASRSSEVDARLIALNMALNGQSREEADRYLAENFDIADRGALLDEVFSAVEG